MPSVVSVALAALSPLIALHLVEVQQIRLPPPEQAEFEPERSALEVFGERAEDLEPEIPDGLGSRLLHRFCQDLRWTRALTWCAVGHGIGFWSFALARLWGWCRRSSPPAGGRAVRSRISEHGRARRSVLG